MSALIAFLRDGIANHFVVVLIGLFFLLLQIVLCVRFLRQVRRQERILDALNADVAHGGDGRSIGEYNRIFPWLAWVDANFPRDHRTPGHYTRDDVLKELDSRLAANANYLLLQRTGVMAPLLGVVMTVIGFGVLSQSEEMKAMMSTSDNATDILRAMMPLGWGVGTGAILGFICQWLLHFAGNRVESLRTAARTWFDVAIWSSLGLDSQAATVKAITAIEKMSKQISDSADVYALNSERFTQSGDLVEQAAARLDHAVQVIGQKMSGIPESLAELKAAAQVGVESLHTLGSSGHRVLAGLDVSVAAFRSAVDTQFVEAAKLHRTAIAELEESVGRISESTAHLKLGCGDLQETVNAHSHSFQALNRTLQRQVLPAHEAFHASMSQFAGRAENTLERLDELHGQLTTSLERLAGLAPAAEEAIGKFTSSGQAFSHAVLEKFAPAAAEHLIVVESLEAAVSGVSESSKTLQTGSEQLAAALTTQADAARTLQDSVSRNLLPSQQHLQTATQSFEATARGLSQQVDGIRTVLQTLAAIGPAVTSFEEAVQGPFASAASEQQRHAATVGDTLARLNQTAHGLSSGTASIERLSAFIDGGLAPVTQKLDETLARLTATVESLREFTSIRGEIAKLTEALSQAASASDAIAALPEQMRGVVADSVRENNHLASVHSGGTMFGWLRRR